MKKLLCTALAVITTLTMVACSSSKGDGEVNDTASSTQKTTTAPATTSKENLSDKVSDLGEDVNEGMDDAGNAVRDMLE
ncbi:MAG: hypothetical protein IJ401_08530 [Oscillospiraceae bacterium]|nr:hypothetical protein [Oscillospiraceae bacterium]